jgi:hypothetical protein
MELNPLYARIILFTSETLIGSVRAFVATRRTRESERLGAIPSQSIVTVSAPLRDSCASGPGNRDPGTLKRMLMR